MNACENHPGVIFVIIGPGGAGKNAIMKALFAVVPNVHQLATATTRKMRCDETQGREHHFVSRAEFARMVDADQLLEYQEVTPGKYYGIPRQSVVNAMAKGAVLMADIDVFGAKALTQAFRQNVVQIFVNVPGAGLRQKLETLRNRMQERADQNTDIEERLQRAETVELPYEEECDYVVLNDELPQAASRMRAIVEHELAARGLWNGSA